MRIMVKLAGVLLLMLFPSETHAERLDCAVTHWSSKGISNMAAFKELVPAQTSHRISGDQAVIRPHNVRGEVTRRHNRIRILYHGSDFTIEYVFIPSTSRLVVHLNFGGGYIQPAGASGKCSYSR